MAEMLPGYLQDPQVHKTWAADIVGEAISSRIGVPIIPFAMGYAVGNVMRMQVLDGEVYTLQLPSADYAISVDFKGFKKLKFKESSAGTSYVYGTFADMRIQEPNGPVFLGASLKNAEVKVVPSTQTQDRKSTRLNSSHLVISYAVFCLKKKSRNCPGNFLIAIC